MSSDLGQPIAFLQPAPLPALSQRSSRQPSSIVAAPVGASTPPSVSVPLLATAGAVATAAWSVLSSTRTATDRRKQAPRCWLRLRRVVAVAATDTASTSDGSSDYASEEVRRKLHQVKDPGLGSDIVSLGFVSDIEADRETGRVTIRLEVGAFEETVRAEVQQLPWVREVVVNIPSAASRQPAEKPPERAMPRIPVSLKKVKSIIAVSSCKGGVGKSTVAVNLAYQLRKSGAEVGIFDCDVYGPSLPVMVRLDEEPNMQMYEGDDGQKHIVPVVDPKSGIKLVSFGYAGKAAVMRGSMVTGLISQLLTQSDWGDLDYLVLDLPPGTGDIHLTLAQVCQITAAVIVTTPQKLSIIDVERGISMFSQLAVPSVAVVQNMSYMAMPNGERTYPFGNTNAGRTIAETFGIDHVFELPIDPQLAEAGDTGQPYAAQGVDGTVSAEIEQLANAVAQEVDSILAGAKKPVVVYDDATGCLRVELPDGEVFGLDPEVLRSRDKGVGGARPPEPGARVAEIRDMGNYAVVLRWSDGFVQVAPHKQLIYGDEKGPMPRVPLNQPIPQL